MTDQPMNLHAPKIDIVEVDGAGGVVLFKSGELPGVREWAPSHQFSESADSLLWSFLPAGSPYRLRPGAYFEVSGREGWRVKRDAATGVPVGFAIDEATARGYSFIRVDLARTVKACADNVDEVNLSVYVTAIRGDEVELTCFGHSWQEQHSEHTPERLGTTEWKSRASGRDTGVVQPA